MIRGFFQQSKIAKILVLLSVCVFVVLVVSFMHPRVKSIMVQASQDSELFISDKINDKKIEFLFECNNNNLSIIKFRFSTYGNKVKKGSLKFTLMENESNKIIAETVIAAKKIKQNKYIAFEFDALKSSKNKVYKVSISTEDLTDPITIYASNLSSKGVSTFINGEQTKIPTFEVYITKKTYPYSWDVLLVLTLLVTLIGVCPINNSTGKLNVLNLKEKN